MRTMRILVTGGAGYIGSPSVPPFLSRRHEVTGYDNLTAGPPPAVPRECPLGGYLAHAALPVVLARAYPWGFAALRYFNAAGASADGVIAEDRAPETHLIPLILQVCLGQRPHIEVFGTDYPTPDGTCIRDYIHVEDLAE